MIDIQWDAWSSSVSLLLMFLGFLSLAIILARRTRRWNGVGRAMQALMVFAALLYAQGAYNTAIREWGSLPHIPVEVRIGTRFLAVLSVFYAIYKVSTVDLVAVKNLTSRDQVDPERTHT
ncbi:MAG TPA: hypothetical protein VFQ54_01805 [Thermomicrobiales bacterium]|nr:hypothetical protein [Thermomicrobiales bacterium]